MSETTNVVEAKLNPEAVLVDLWRRLMVPRGFPDVKPDLWTDRTRSVVSRAAADLTRTELLLRRVVASGFLAHDFRPDLRWVLDRGRERIEGGRFDNLAGA